MLPILFSIGGFKIYALSIILLLAWLVFSFLFWRNLRRFAVEEDRIFDLTFYSTLVALFVSRFGFIITHGEIFAGKSWLLWFAVWIAPGMSWFGALIGGLATLVFLSRQYKVRLGLVLDSLAFSLLLPIIVGKVGSLLDGAEIGRATALPWGIHYLGADGSRHPVQLYDMIAIILLAVALARLNRMAITRKWPYGMIGIWFFLLYSAAMFILEIFKDSRVYWANVTANQWILIGIFAECIGVLYVRGGGREHLRPWIRVVGSSLKNGLIKIYATISRRHTSGDQKAS